jgi:hypothetical protein
MIRIGIIGHRFFYDNYTKGFVIKECLSILLQAKKSYNNVVAVSAIAEGADTIFAEVAALLNIPLEIVTPFHDYITDFETFYSKDRYLTLKRIAEKEIKLPYAIRSEEAYFHAMQWVIKESDVSIAVWDGRENKGKASTASTVKELIRNKKNWIHLDVLCNSVKFYSNHAKINMYEI